MASLRVTLPVGCRKAASVVGDDQSRRRRRGTRQLDAHRLRLAVSLRVADGLTSDAVDERVVLAARQCRLVDRQLRRDARGRQRAEEVAQRHLQTGRLEVRRVDLDEQGPQVADPLTERGRGILQRSRLRVVAAAFSILGQRRKPERDPCEILHDAVVQVGGDAAALLGRGLHRAHQQSLALPVRTLQPSCHRPRERKLEQDQHEHAGEQRRGQGAKQPLGARAHRAEALVDLEQHLRAVRCADRRVRLEQLAVRTLVAVLRPAEIAELGLGFAGLEQPPLVRAKREPLTDERGLVGVQDRSVLRPQFHAHERSGDDLAQDEVIQPLDVLGVAPQEAVAQSGGLDQPSLRLNALAGVALRLVDRDLAQREEASDDDHCDRSEAGEHEPRHRHIQARGRPRHAIGGSGPIALPGSP